MPLYEHIGDAGKVTERVRTAPNSLEDNRLGVAAEETRKAKRKSGWHLVDESAKDEAKD